MTGPRRFQRSVFLKAAFFLQPWCLIPLGIVLVLSSLVINVSNETGLVVLRRHDGWITAIREVTGGITAIQSTKNILGLVVYVLGLAFAITTAVLFCIKTLRVALTVRTRLRTAFAAMAAFLAVFAALDLCFGWIGLMNHARKEHIVTFGLWLASWILAFLGLAQSVAESDSASGQMHQWPLIVAMPALLLDIVMAPALLENGSLIYMPGLISWVAGLQLIWWGYVQAFSNQAPPPSA